MNRVFSARQFLAIALIASFMGGMVGVAYQWSFAGPSASQSSALNQWTGVSPYSYLIFTDGATVYAKNGSTGSIDYSGTDAATVINSVTTALKSGGGVVQVRGNLSIASTIYLWNSTWLRGEGVGYNGLYGTTLGLTASVPLIEVSGTSNQYFVHISDMELIGNGRTAVAGVYGIWFATNCSDYLLNNILVHGFNVGIELDYGWYGRLQDVWCESNSVGLVFNGTYYQTVSDSSISGNGSYGIYFGRLSTEILLSNTQINLNWAAVEIESLSGTALNQNYRFIGCQLLDSTANKGVIIWVYASNHVNVTFEGCDIGHFQAATQTTAFQYWTNGAGTLKLNVYDSRLEGLLANAGGTGQQLNIMNNIGFVTSYSSSAVNSTANTFVFTHGLAGTPNAAVSASFNDTGITGYSVAVTSSLITITITGTPVSTTPLCYVHAEYKP